MRSYKSTILLYIDSSNLMKSFSIEPFSLGAMQCEDQINRSKIRKIMERENIRDGSKKIMFGNSA